MPGSRFRTVFIGASAGLLASYAMERVQSAIKSGHERTGDKPGRSGGAPSTQQLADRVSDLVTGRPVPESKKADAGRIVHYVTGSGLGVLYALLARRSAGVTNGFGLLFGLAVSLVLDETIVPALGLSPPPNESSLTSHLDGFAGHAVFGASLEGARRLLDSVVW